MIVDGAMETWKSYQASEEEQDLLVSNFTALLDSLSQDQDDFFALLLIILEKMEANQKGRATADLRGILAALIRRSAGDSDNEDIKQSQFTFGQHYIPDEIWI